MNQPLRRKSPRAPSISLEDAIERALKIYDKEGRHPSPSDVVAQDIGYKSANNGTASSTLASLRYYGLVERPKDGFLSVTRDVEAYKFAPSDSLRQELLIKWLKTPPVFADLLENYSEKLPSDATVKFDLIQRGFSAKFADECLSVFRRSIEFAHFYEQQNNDSPTMDAEIIEEKNDTKIPQVAVHIEKPASSINTENVTNEPPANNSADRIPVRLAGGRKAWLEIPAPFYEADKKRLISQIQLLLTDDGEDEDETE